MARHGYGSGEYRYFAYPLPATVAALREGLYPPLAGIANRWGERLGEDRRFPPRLDDWLAECHAAGQVRPTPLLLKYGPRAYNCLHPDPYCEHVLPNQAAFLLSHPGAAVSASECWRTE